MPTLAASYSGFVNGDTSASLTSQPVIFTTATAHSPVSAGPYPIIASGAADVDYTISYVFGALTVTPAALTITANNQTKVYGAAMPTLTVSYSGLVNGDTAATFSHAPNTAPSIVSTATASSHVSGSPYTITASGAADSNYSISYVSGTLTVTPAALTITANNQTKVYGAALPTLTVSYSGFVNGDTSASLTTQPTVTTTATAASHVSGNPYSITASGASDAPSGAAFLGTAANYNVYVSGNMSENGGSAATSIAVGGNASITQFSLAGGSGNSLVVGGNFNSTGTQILSGNAQVAGSVTMGTNDNAALASGATLYYGSTTGNTFPSFPIFNITHAANGGISAGLFSGANATLTSDSSVLAAQPQNGTVTFAFGTLTLTGSSTSTNYFNVSGANLASTSSMQISVPTGATVFINVSGVTDQFSGANISISGTTADKVLFNFYQATSVTLSGIELKGSLLAPLATLYASGGQTDGNVMVAGISVTNGFAYQSSALFDGNSPGAADYTISYVAGALTVTPARAHDHRRQPDQCLWRRSADPDGQLLRLRQWRHLVQPDHTAHADDDGHGRQPCLEQPLRHHGQRRRRQRLLDQLRGRNAHRHAGALDDHRRQQNQGLRRGAADADDELYRPGQRRYRRQPHHPAGCHHHRHERQPCLGQPLQHHRQRRGGFRLQHQLRGRHLDRHPGGANHHRC